MTTPTDPIEELQARVAFLEETLYNLGALLTGKKQLTELPTSGKIPLSAHDQGRVLTAAAELLVGSRTPNCPPWCKFGGGEPSDRPSNWPDGDEASAS